MNTEKKSGWKTTEFWAMTAGSLVAILNSAFDLNIDQGTIVAVAGMIATYVIGRSVAKKS